MNKIDITDFRKQRKKKSGILQNSRISDFLFDKTIFSVEIQLKIISSYFLSL